MTKKTLSLQRCFSVTTMIYNDDFIAKKYL